MELQDLKLYRIARSTFLETQERLEEYRTVVLSPGISNYSGMPSCQTSGNDRTAIVIDRLMKLEAEHIEAANAFAAAGLVLDRARSVLNDEERKVLRELYELGHTWEQSRNNLYMSRKKLCNLRRKMLEKIKLL